jgi:hypothetical protein
LKKIWAKVIVSFAKQLKQDLESVHKLNEVLMIISERTSEAAQSNEKDSLMSEEQEMYIYGTCLPGLARRLV